MSKEECPTNYKLKEILRFTDMEVFRQSMHRLLEDTPSEIAYAIIKIDKFEDVNYLYSYKVGQEIITHAAQILKHYQSDEVLVTHIYENMFGICVKEPNLTIRDSLLDSMRICINDELKDKCSILPLTTTISVAEATIEDTVDTLMQKANIVISEVESKNANRLVYYEEAMGEKILREAKILDHLQKEMLNEHIYFVFQPIYELNTDIVIGYESLMRMKDSEGDVISPVEFIPLAEKNNLIIDLGYFTMEEACKAFKIIREKDKRIKYISINVSIYQFRDKEIVEKMVAIAKAHDVEMKHIAIELTESAVIRNIEEVTKMIEAFRSYGAHVLLDDFGTGYSSLSYLTRIPIDTVKIDKTFLETLNINNKVNILIERTINLMHALGFNTVVEGVETKEEMETIKASGAEHIQGYYISEPKRLTELFVDTI